MEVLKRIYTIMNLQAILIVLLVGLYQVSSASYQTFAQQGDKILAYGSSDDYVLFLQQIADLPDDSTVETERALEFAQQIADLPDDSTVETERALEFAQQIADLPDDANVDTEREGFY